MKNLIFISFIIFQLFFSKIIIVNSELSHGILEDDYNCINNLLNYTQIIGLIDQNNDNDYCNRTLFNTNQIDIICAEDYSIMNLNITANITANNLDIEYEHINCFTNLQYVIFNKFKFKIDSFGNENNSTKMKAIAVNIFINDCEFVDGELSSNSSIIPKGTEMFKITLSSNLSNLQSIKFNSIKNINKSFIVEYLLGTIPNGLQLPILDNDLLEQQGTFESWEFIVNNIPSMNFVTVENLTLNVIPISTSIEIDNILTYTNVIQLNLIYNTGEIYLSNFTTIPTIKHLHIGGPIGKPTDKLDLSNTTFETLDFGNLSPDFHINNELPISKLPNTIKYFSIENSDFNSFDVSLFVGTDIETIIIENCNIPGELPDITPITKLKTLGLSNNRFTSTIPESYCSIPILFLSNNNITGKLNTCHSCYVLYNPELLENLNNTNLDLSYSCPNGSIEPSLDVSQINDSIYKFIVTGNNLFYDDPSEISNFTFDLIKSNQLYFEGDWNVSVLGPIPDEIELSFGDNKFKFLTMDNVAPKVLNYSRNESNFTFNGMYFSNNTSDFKVDIGDVVCTILEISNESISCSIGLDDWNTSVPSSNDVKTVITNIVTGKSHQITISSKGAKSQDDVKDCNVTCINDGYCSTKKGECICPDGEWSGADCSIPIFKCPNNCTYPNGVCDGKNGKCTCESNWQDKDCSVPYLECPDNCSGLGKCDTKTGSCNCKANYAGLNCSLPSQYISSIQPSNTDGGTVKIWGWFGDVHENLSIKIGKLDCEIESVSSNLIVCTIGGGSGTKSVTIIQNGVKYIGVDKYNYIKVSYKCPNDCSNNGKCNTVVGLCKCNSKWGGFDCSLRKSNPHSSTSTTTTSSTTSTSSTSTPKPTPEPNVTPSTETKVDTTSGSAIISNQQTSYEIRIISLVELDFNQEIVKTNLLQNQWIFDNSISNIYNFSQQLNETDCVITYTIEELKEDREYSFADLDLSLEKDNIKITIEIKNYPYISSLNTIQLQMESKVGENDDTTKEDGGECNKETSNVDANQMDKDQLINYISISKDQKVLYGRFINRIVSDTKPTFITTSVVSNDNNNLMIGVNLPHCSESCLIDPDFGLLVSSDYKKCENDNGRASWVLPVAIVIPCVVVASLIIVGAIIYSKKHTSILLTKEKYSLKLRGLSKKSQDLPK